MLTTPHYEVGCLFVQVIYSIITRCISIVYLGTYMFDSTYLCRTNYASQ